MGEVARITRAEGKKRNPEDGEACDCWREDGGNGAPTRSSIATGLLFPWCRSGK